MNARWILIVLAALAIATPAIADHKYGRQVRFVGIHPIPRAEGGGMCYIEGPHVHIYVANKLEYRDHAGDNYFVGDPVAYNYEGPKYAYKGPHPIHVDAVVGGDPDEEYCYLDGPHYHYFAPPEGPDFRMTGGAYFYVGTPPQPFIEARPAYVGINTTYRPMVYTRPVVEVDAPVGWVGARAEFVAPAVVVAPPRAAIVAPGVVVQGGVGIAVPAPSVHVGIEVGVPGVVVAPAPVVVVPAHGKFKHGKFRHR
jgi:hypothetical protein